MKTISQWMYTPVCLLWLQNMLQIPSEHCLWIVSYHTGLPDSSDSKESVYNAGDLGSIPGSGRPPWRRAWQPTPVFLPGESHGQRSLAGYSPWGRKESDMTETPLHAQSTIIVLARKMETMVHNLQKNPCFPVPATLLTEKRVSMDCWAAVGL